MAVICLVVKSSNALAKVLFFVRRLEVGHHLAEVVEEGAELDEVEVDSTTESFWNEAVSKEEAQSNLQKRNVRKEKKCQIRKEISEKFPKRRANPTSAVGA